MSGYFGQQPFGGYGFQSSPTAGITKTLIVHLDEAVAVTGTATQRTDALLVSRATDVQFVMRLTDASLPSRSTTAVLPTRSTDATLPSRTTDTTDLDWQVSP